jgi:hypothetical protein
MNVENSSAPFHKRTASGINGNCPSSYEVRRRFDRLDFPQGCGRRQYGEVMAVFESSGQDSGAD